MSAIEIRAIRARTGMSQEAFAKALEVSRGAVIDWESGDQSVKNLHVYAARYLAGERKLPTRHILVHSATQSEILDREMVNHLNPIKLYSDIATDTHIYLLRPLEPSGLPLDPGAPVYGPPDAKLKAADPLQLAADFLSSIQNPT